jgi:DoxX-like family
LRANAPQSGPALPGAQHSAAAIALEDWGTAHDLTLTLETNVAWIASHFTDGLAAAFAALAMAHLAAVKPLRDAYARWGVPAGFAKVTGVLLALSAVLLAFSPTRLLGFAVAALMLFLSATTLLHRRQYGVAAPVIVALFALIPVTLSGSV